MTIRVEHTTEPWPTKVERLSLPATIYCECPVCGAGNSQDLYLSYPWLNTEDEYLTLTCLDCEEE